MIVITVRASLPGDFVLEIISNNSSGSLGGISQRHDTFANQFGLRGLGEVVNS